MTLREDWVDAVGQQVDAAFLNQVGAEVNANTADIAGLTADDIADGTTYKRYSATEKTKLAGIAAGATANDTDANLKARANHTGSQSSSTISDFTEAVQDVVGAFMSGTTGVTVSYNDAGNAITVTGLGDASATAEAIRDAMGIAMVGTGLISVVPNDGADTITISTTATANDTDANLKARANHTGTQSADTLTDGTTNKAFLATERTKLSGIEAAADVTDAANVAAAGAVMTSGIGVSVQAYDADLTTWGGKTAPSGTVVGTTPAITSTASSATPALDVTKEQTHITALAAAMTAISMSATFAAGQKHLLRIKDNGTARALTFTSSVIQAADGITLPTTTVVGKTHEIGLKYDEVVGKLIALAVGSY